MREEKREKKIQRDPEQINRSKKKARILIISMIVATVLLVALNAVDYDALADKLVGGDDSQKQELVTYPEHYFEEPVYDEDINLDEQYLELDRYIYLKIGNEINQLSGSSYEADTMEKFWIDYFDAVKGADNDLLNSLHTSHFLDQNGKYGKFAPQKVYKIKVDVMSSEKVEDGEFSGCYRYFVKVNYNIFENNGTFRNDIRSDESREQIFEMLEGRFGFCIHSVSYPSENVPVDQNEGFAFMIIVWIVLIILSVVIEMMTGALISIWFMPAGLAALVLSMFDLHIALQIGAYLLIAIVLIIMSRTVFKDKLFSKKAQKEDKDEQQSSDEEQADEGDAE